MLPEEKARVKIDKQLNNAGWDIVDRKDYLPNYAMAVKEALMQGGKESDYLLFVDNKAIGVVEAKKESDSLGPKVASQAEHYAKTPQNNNKADKSASNSLNSSIFEGLVPLCVPDAVCFSRHIPHASGRILAERFYVIGTLRSNFLLHKKAPLPRCST